MLLFGYESLINAKDENFYSSSIFIKFIKIFIRLVLDVKWKIEGKLLVSNFYKKLSYSLYEIIFLYISNKIMIIL